MAEFLPQAYPGGRIPLASGRVTVGAVFPPVGDPPGPWVWRLFAVGDLPARDGRAKTEAAARVAILGAWRDVIDQAGLCKREAGE